MPARTSSCVFARMVDVGEMRARLGPGPIGCAYNPPHIDRTIFVTARHSSGQGVNNYPDALFPGLSLCTADQGHKLNEIGIA